MKHTGKQKRRVQKGEQADRRMREVSFRCEKKHTEGGSSRVLPMERRASRLDRGWDIDWMRQSAKEENNTE